MLPPGDEVGASEERTCYICLDASPDATGAPPVRSPCRCPRYVHGWCLGRWQLQSAGGPEERECRFCGEGLPDWRDALGPPAREHAPVMTVTVGGATRHIRVGSGPGAQERFEAGVRAAFGIPPGVAVNMTFDCRVPGDGSRLKLRGNSAFHAAVHCARTCPVSRLDAAVIAGELVDATAAGCG